MSVLESLFGLDGRRALVTGASRGIGRAIALGYAEAGADVAVLARDAAALTAVADEIEKLGRRALVLPCDVTDAGQVADAVDRAVAEFGGLDVLVNNAGGMAHAGPLLAQPYSDWTETGRLSLDSVVRLCQAVGPHLTAQGSGAVINMSSVAGLAGVPMISMYAAAKAAVISLTRSLAAEWAAAGVRVNALAPGWIASDLTRNFFGDPQIRAGLLRAVPTGRLGEPSDVVGAAIFLAADASRTVTGACLTGDGGMSAYVGGPTLIDLLAAGRVAT
jgi:NAD(P)-dependent dehydrogenase (short-subunit alcohol dehydrogenase family)